MKLTVLLFTAALLVFAGEKSHAQLTCNDDAQTIQGGVDILPWSYAKPFPWDNIEGYWKLGDDDQSYIKATVLSSSQNRKFLSLQVYGDGYCSKPYAKGTGYVDISEKNVVRAILFDNNFRYQMKLGLFDVRDIIAAGDICNGRVMAASMQVVGRTRAIYLPAKPAEQKRSETKNMLLKKVSVDPEIDCK